MNRKEFISKLILSGAAIALIPSLLPKKADDYIMVHEFTLCTSLEASEVALSMHESMKSILEKFPGRRIKGNLFIGWKLEEFKNDKVTVAFKTIKI